MIRRDETVRREFLDDLLGGHVDVADLVARAERFGLRVTAPHLVLVVAATVPVRDTTVATAGVEELLRSRLPGRDLLVGTSEGRLVCVVSAAAAGRIKSADREVLAKLARKAVVAVAGASPEWRAGIGRSHAGPTGIATSYREAGQALDLAERLGRAEQVVYADQQAVYDVLLRDTGAITELVHGVLGPLAEARGGAESLVDTLAEYMASGAVATETARRLHLSVRAVTYRLHRIHTLTGYDPTDPADWLTLLVAVNGARLLGWP